VTAGGPASEAGIRKGDILTQIGEIALDETHSYTNSLFKYKPGDQILVQLVRNGEKIQVQVTLSEASSG
jgi:S1-C subfamily serine protease